MNNLAKLTDQEIQAINGGHRRSSTDVEARGKYAVAAKRTRDIFQDSSIQSMTISGGRLTANDSGIIGFYNA